MKVEFRMRNGEGRRKSEGIEDEDARPVGTGFRTRTITKGEYDGSERKGRD